MSDSKYRQAPDRRAPLCALSSCRLLLRLPHQSLPRSTTWLVTTAAVGPADSATCCPQTRRRRSLKFRTLTAQKALRLQNTQCVIFSLHHEQPLSWGSVSVTIVRSWRSVLGSQRTWRKWFNKSKRSKDMHEYVIFYFLIFFCCLVNTETPFHSIKAQYWYDVNSGYLDSSACAILRSSGSLKLFWNAIAQRALRFALYSSFQ